MGNGEVEKHIQEVQGQIQTSTLNIEANYNTQLKDYHPAVPWLVAHTASLRTRTGLMRMGHLHTKYGKEESIAEQMLCLWNVLFIKLWDQKGLTNLMKAGRKEFG